MGGAFGAATAALVDLGIGFFGDGRTVTLYRPANVYDPELDTDVTALELDAAAAADDTVIALRRVGGGALSGEIPEQLEITVGVNVYRAVSPAPLQAGVAQVTITPPLVAPVNEGDPATLAERVALPYRRMQTRIRLRDIDNKVIRGTDQVLAVSATGALAAPQVKDVTDGGQTVRTVLPIGDSAAPAGWHLHMGEAT